MACNSFCGHGWCDDNVFDALTETPCYCFLLLQMNHLWERTSNDLTHLRSNDKEQKNESKRERGDFCLYFPSVRLLFSCDHSAPRLFFVNVLVGDCYVVIPTRQAVEHPNQINQIRPSASRMAKAN